MKLNSRRHQCPVSFATLYVPFNNVNVEGATSNPDDGMIFNCHKNFLLLNEIIITLNFNKLSRLPK